MAGRMQGAQIWRRILAAPAWHARLRATPSFWAAKKDGGKSRQEVFLPDCPAARHIGTACQAVRALGGCGLTRQGDMNFRNIAQQRWIEVETSPECRSLSRHSSGRIGAVRPHRQWRRGHRARVVIGSPDTGPSIANAVHHAVHVGDGDAEIGDGDVVLLGLA